MIQLFHSAYLFWSHGWKILFLISDVKYSEKKIERPYFIIDRYLVCNLNEFLFEITQLFHDTRFKQPLLVAKLCFLSQFKDVHIFLSETSLFQQLFDRVLHYEKV